MDNENDSIYASRLANI